MACPATTLGTSIDTLIEQHRGLVEKEEEEGALVATSTQTEAQRAPFGGEAGAEVNKNNNNKRGLNEMVVVPGSKRAKKAQGGRQWGLGDLLNFLVRLLWCLPPRGFV
jgi:hypothetical protein